MRITYVHLAFDNEACAQCFPGDDIVAGSSAQEALNKAMKLILDQGGTECPACFSRCHKAARQEKKPYDPLRNE